jgi:hypothetical protein
VHYESYYKLVINSPQIRKLIEEAKKGKDINI